MISTTIQLRNGSASHWGVTYFIAEGEHVEAFALRIAKVSGALAYDVSGDKIHLVFAGKE
jgi:hypothetical protein